MLSVIKRKRDVFNKSFFTILEISLAINELEKSLVIKFGKAIGIGSTTPSVTSISNSGTFACDSPLLTNVNDKKIIKHKKDIKKLTFSSLFLFNVDLNLC